MSYHCYADDRKIYFSAKPNYLNQLSSLNECLAATKDWMSSNFLHLNSDKTEIILFGPDKFVTAVDQLFGPLRINIKPRSSIWVSSSTSMWHLTFILQTCPVSFPAATRCSKNQKIHSFIFSHLDYCNSLYTCLSQASLNRLQLVQNVAARLFLCVVMFIYLLIGKHFGSLRQKGAIYK